MLHKALHLPPEKIVRFSDDQEPVELNPGYPESDAAYQLEYNYYASLVEDLKTANKRIYNQAQYLSLFYGTRPVYTRVEVIALRDEYLTNIGMIDRANKRLDELARALNFADREESFSVIP